MRKDERLNMMAKNVLTNSVKLQKGDKIYIEAFGNSTQDLFKEFISEATKMGAILFYYFNDNEFKKKLMENSSEEQIKAHGQIHVDIMKQADVYIGIRGDDDLFALSDIDEEQMMMYQKHYSKPVHSEVRCGSTRWCVMRYPNKTMACSAKMSLEAFEDFYFDSCLLDYTKMSKAMDSLVNVMAKTDNVKIIAPNTNIEFSIKGMGAIKCDGGCNIPDGEVYSAPLKESINGYIQFNTDTVLDGTVYSNIKLEFEKGKIIKASSMLNDEKFQAILDIDDGARYIGEFALGLNPYITKPILDILFDEKICCSLHMAIGSSYDNMCNTNKSAIHWDLIQIQTPEAGGGEIYFDDILIRKDGLFVIDELKCLNPENLR